MDRLTLLSRRRTFSPRSLPRMWSTATVFRSTLFVLPQLRAAEEKPTRYKIGKPGDATNSTHKPFCQPDTLSRKKQSSLRVKQHATNLLRFGVFLIPAADPDLSFRTTVHLKRKTHAPETTFPISVLAATSHLIGGRK